MHTGSEEVGDDDEPAHAASDEHIGSFFDIGAAEFQECGFHVSVLAGACKLRCRFPDSFVGGFDSGAVGEDDDSSSHALLMYWRMWWISSVFWASS